MTSFLKDRDGREQEERMVQEQVSPDFLDPAHAWRRLFAEAWGTFLLVVVAAGGGVVAAKSGGAVTLGMIVVAPGLMLLWTPNLRQPLKLERQW
jgi:aquaporin Z